MARGSQPKSSTSRVRFIMLEADINDGDLAQITQAIQNALRPAQPAPRLIHAPPAASPADSLPIDEFEDVQVDAEEVSLPRASKPRKPRVAKTPTVLDDIDLESEPSLKDFVAQYELTTAVDKYLVIALWFREARDIASVSVDHVYTCFRALNWSTKSNDFAKPLRNLRDEQAMRGGSKDGFSLTLVGAGKIEEKKKA